MLLLTKRCPHTGVLNVYADTDPYFSVGSIARQPGKGFTWRCYVGGSDNAGRAADIETAERQLLQFLAPVADGRSHRRHVS